MWKWLARALGFPDPGQPRPPPAPQDAFGNMLWLGQNLPPEGFVALPLAMTHPQPRYMFRFAPTARPAHAGWLVATVRPGQMLGFYDRAFPSLSDLGGFVTAVREDDGPGVSPWPWRVQVANHGWHTAWHALDAPRLADWLWACRAEHTAAGPGSSEASNPGHRLTTGPAPRHALAEPAVDDPTSTFQRAIDRRLKEKAGTD